MRFANIQFLLWFINYVNTNIYEGSSNMTLCWCVFSGKFRQINVVVIFILLLILDSPKTISWNF